MGFEPTVTLPPQWFSRALVVRRPARLLPGLSACRSSASSKIIPRISRDDSSLPSRALRRGRPAGALSAVAVTVAVSRWSCSPSPRSSRLRDSALSCPDPSPEPDSCRTGRQTGSVKGRRSRSRVTPKAPLTGSGCRKYSYGGFGGGHPHFHPHATPVGNPRIKRRAHTYRKSSNSSGPPARLGLRARRGASLSSALRWRCCYLHFWRAY